MHLQILNFNELISRKSWKQHFFKRITFSTSVTLYMQQHKMKYSIFVYINKSTVIRVILHIQKNHFYQIQFLLLVLYRCEPKFE